MQNQTKPKPLGAPMAKLVLAVAIIVSLGALLGAAGYFWTMPKSEVVINNGIEKEEAQDEKIIEDETADWQTYKNEEYGFEFKYPTDWFIYSDRTEAQTRIIQVASSLDRKIGEGTTFLGPALDIRIPGENNDKGISINMFGKNARDTDWQGASMGLAISRQISILTSPCVVIYLRTSISGELINSEKLTLNQILSTFKFIEK